MSGEAKPRRDPIPFHPRFNEAIRLQSIDKQEARLEGLGSVYEFEQVWRQLYDRDPYRRWERNPPVFRIEFRCVTPPAVRFVPLDHYINEGLTEDG